MRVVPLRALLLLLLAALLSGCGYNQIQQKDEAVKAGWSEVLNQYKRRADLIPNLVNTVKGYAAHERETLDRVIEARNRAQASHGAVGEQSADERQLVDAAVALHDLVGDAGEGPRHARRVDHHGHGRTSGAVRRIAD